METLKKAVKRWLEIQKSEHDQKRKGNPVFAMIENMFNSDNPVQRAVAIIATQVLDEDSDELERTVLAEELAISADEPVGIATPKDI